ncbi:uncharacterized protein LOC133178939 [Saccostrea echinata]|uniref:uncharacterized protein LOC133178939 n=1 Tax=Saccostrea echinata TaxID=191078 RepID=UPI002A840800|nr:uncharacterized protein LOC133178939 [Saccostrea echinata]
MNASNTSSILFFTRISKDDYLNSERQKKFHYPTLIDINGFQDIFLEKLIVLLRYVLFGLITDKHELLDALKFYGYNDIKQAMTYLSKQEKMRVDGLTVVTSAVSSLPHNILNAVKQVAVKEMEVPVFGVLTELDKVNDWEALAIKKKEFCSKLGLPETRLLLCTNYCDDYDKCSGNSRLNQVHPELDVPILSFMRQVCDIVNIHTKLEVIHSSEVILCSALQGPRMRAQLQGASSRNEQELVTMEYSNFVYNSGPVYSDLALAMGLTTCLPNNVPTNLSDGWAGKQRARCVHNPPTHPSGPATDIDMMFLHYFTLGDTFPFP